MTFETRDRPNKSPAVTRRTYVPPAIVDSREAFEHAILTCTGQDLDGFCSQPAQPKGGCLVVCTASS